MVKQRPHSLIIYFNIKFFFFSIELPSFINKKKINKKVKTMLLKENDVCNLNNIVYIFGVVL